MNRPSQWYQLDPVDAWFFRDGRPSNRDEDQSDLESLFPPHNSTVVGALRAALAREHGWNGRGGWPSDVKAVLGDGFDDLGQLECTGPFLARDGGLLFPMPQHVLGRTETRANRTRFKAMDWIRPSQHKVVCDAGQIHLPITPDNGTPQTGMKPLSQASGFYVTTGGMTKILQGQLPDVDDCLHQDDLFCLESRVGIKRHPETRTTGEGAMYSPRYVRLKPGVSLLVGLGGLPDDWTPSAVFPLGGESRLASCSPMDTPDLPMGNPDGGDCVIALIAPACFTGEPWYGAGPSQAATQLASELSGTVKTLVIDRPVRIGGWDTLKGAPLPLCPFVVPGSVWWLETPAEQAPIKAPIRLGHKTSYGYGLALVGRSPA